MTNFKTIVDVAHTTLYQNYKLDNLLRADEQMFYKFLYNMVNNSIDMFDGSLEDLTYHSEIINDETQYFFDRDLSSKEIYILALGIAIGLYRRELDDVTVYQTKLSTKEFKQVGDAQNLKARENRLEEMKEDLSQHIVDYQLSKISKNGMNYFGFGG